MMVMRSFAFLPLLVLAASADHDFLRGQSYDLMERRLNINTSWVQWGQRLSGTSATERYGDTVGLSASGMVLAVGSPLGGTDVAGTNERGFVRLYQFVLGTNWTQAGSRIDGTEDNINLGSTLDLSGDGRRVVLGMPLANKVITTMGANNQATTITQARAGRVATYQYVNNNWAIMGDPIHGPTINETGAAAGFLGDVEFGFDVSMSADGKRIAASAIRSDGVNRTVKDAGAVMVFEYSATAPFSHSQVGQTIHGEVQDEMSGYTVDLSSDGGIVAIGNGVATAGAGRVRIYKFNRSNKTWAMWGSPIVGLTAVSGISLSSDGTKVAVGTALAIANNLAEAGIVQVYEYNDATRIWDKVGLPINGAKIKDLVGTDVSLSANGNRLSVQSESSVRQFEYNNMTWVQVGKTITNTASPTSSAMSDDGTKIAIGTTTGTGVVDVYQFPQHSYDLNLAWLGSVFDSSGKPEVEMKIVNSAPRGAQGTGYYTIAVLGFDCATISTDVLKPVVDATNGRIPTANVDVSTSSVNAQIDINATAVKNSTYYYIDPTTKEDAIRFCTKISFFNQGNTVALASLTQKVTIILDKTTHFSLADVDYGSTRPIFETFKYVGLDYPLETFFCNSQNQEVVPTSRFPGQIVQICVKAPQGSPVFVEDVRNVHFKNKDVPLLKIDLVDNEGKAANDQTSKTCSAGVCNVRTVVFHELFENDVNGDGILEDVSQGVSVEGSAMMSFVGRRRTRALQMDMEPVMATDAGIAETVARPQALNDPDVIPVTDFGISIPLHQPPPRTPNRSQKYRSVASTLRLAVSVVAAVAASVLLL